MIIVGELINSSRKAIKEAGRNNARRFTYTRKELKTTRKGKQKSYK